METVIPHSEIKNHSAKKYRTILADPPWGVPLQRGRNSNRSAESHYELMPLDRIMAMPVQDLAEENSHLYLWIPNALLQEGLDVIKAWGFTFRSPIYWIKPRLLLGNYFRNASERMRYCKKMDAYLVERMNQVKPKTLKQIESIWYENYSGNRNGHYHQSRYHFLNLHSFFHGNHTVELRGFNSTLHAGKIRAYIVLALALNHQALSQKSASYRKVQEENEKFAMRVWLNRIGFIGDEFKSCREHLYQHLDGNAAWRYGSQENVRSHINTRNTQNGGSQNEQ